MNISDYIEKTNLFLTNSDFKKVNKLPFTSFTLNTTTIINEHKQFFIEHNTTSYKLMISNPTIPKLYSLPKIHKQGPLVVRPIVSYINSPTYYLTKFLAKLLLNINIQLKILLIFGKKLFIPSNAKMSFFYVKNL